MKTKIYIHSQIGHTPVTERDGAYCDKLVEATIDCKDFNDAKEQLKRIFQQTPFAHYASFDMFEHSNQNLRQQSFIGHNWL